MPPNTPDIAALLGSRICHDLISPVGAITNGLELMTLGGRGASGPEFALVTDSAANAGARIKFFRLAFGQAAENQTVNTHELHDILCGVYTGAQKLDWQVTEALPRPRARAACLALLCLEKCIARGGALTVTGGTKALCLTAKAESLTTPAEYWPCLTTGVYPVDLPPAQVQFALLPLMAHEFDLSIDAQSSEKEALIRIQIIENEPSNRL
ncbi:histidine phosphotransferase family protein [Roseovarius sp. E0-M6]|uniref:histidine phosphotransferase family protein n=1 Tax=Roseovarius sp. E0-M6 TaxID=3127118 RepID=UPI00300FDDCF